MKKSVSDLVGILNLLTDFKESEMQALALILGAKEIFIIQHEQEKKKVPYNFNLLDEIHANENAHSRILVKILQYTYNGEYVLLKMLFDFLGNPFSELQLNKPKISAENNRIDARIRDEDFSIIIENKILGAKDQDQQIERYVTIEREYKYKEPNIYIIYLTLEGGSPYETSITRKRRREFSGRYKEINYRNHVLLWITESVLPWIRSGNNDNITNALILESAIIQYKNFLEGKFYQREGELFMKNSMIKLVTDKLQLDAPTTEIEKMRNIVDYKNYTADLLEFLRQKEKLFVFSVFKKLSDKLCSLHIEGIDNTSSVKEFGELYSEVQFRPFKWNERYLICIGFEGELSGLFYGIKDSSEAVSESLENPLIAELKNVLGIGDDPNNRWLYSDWVLKNEDYVALVNLTEKDYLLEFIKQKVTEILDKTSALSME